MTLNMGTAGLFATNPVVCVTSQIHSGATGNSDERSAQLLWPKTGVAVPECRPTPLKFFLVEDNAIIRENLTETLHEMTGAEVVGSADAEREATLWLCDPENDWDVALVDIFLKRGNGMQVVAALQACRRHRHVIVLSNYASTEIRSQCLRLGADAVFDKSTELDDLIAFCATVKLH